MNRDVQHVVPSWRGHPGHTYDWPFRHAYGHVKHPVGQAVDGLLGPVYWEGRIQLLHVGEEK